MRMRPSILVVLLVLVVVVVCAPRGGDNNDRGQRGEPRRRDSVRGGDRTGRSEDGPLPERRARGDDAPDRRRQRSRRESRDGHSTRRPESLEEDREDGDDREDDSTADDRGRGRDAGRRTRDESMFVDKNRLKILVEEYEDVPLAIGPPVGVPLSLPKVGKAPPPPPAPQRPPPPPPPALPPRVSTSLHARRTSVLRYEPKNQSPLRNSMTIN